MRIEIHIRDTKANGRRVGKRGAFLESCRVYKEAGDGLRLDNLAVPAYLWFKKAATDMLSAWKAAPGASLAVKEAE